MKDFEDISAIKAIIVSPRSFRLYNYWINGSNEKRSLLQDDMRNFCLRLCPSKGKEINKAINNLVPFYLIIETEEFGELELEDDVKTSRASLLLPMRKKVYDRTAKNEQVKSEKEQQASRFSIWKSLNSKLESSMTPHKSFKDLLQLR